MKTDFVMKFVQNVTKKIFLNNLYYITDNKKLLVENWFST